MNTDIEAVVEAYLESYSYWQDDHNMPYIEAIGMVKKIKILTTAAEARGREEGLKEAQRILADSYLYEVVRFYHSNRGSGHTYAAVKGVENTPNALLLVADNHQKQNTGLPPQRQISISENNRGILLGGKRPALVVDNHALCVMYDDLFRALLPKEGTRDNTL